MANDGGETAQEMVDRLSLIAVGERECDLSDNDSAALEWILVSHVMLLDALKDYMSQIGQGLDAHGIAFGVSQQAAHDKAIAAIAKAEGK